MASVDAAPGPSARLASCSICASPSSIYTCPRCSRPTCSLPCSKSHKDRFSCSGARDRAAFVPMKQFGWGQLMTDYGYLEEVGRGVQTAQRETEKRERTGDVKHQAKVKGKMRELVRRAEGQGVELVLMPVGMARRSKNKTGWHPKEAQMHWTVELVFPYPPPVAQPDKPSSSKLPCHVVPDVGASSTTLSEIFTQTMESKKLQLPRRVLQVLKPSSPSSTAPAVVLALPVDPFAPPNQSPRRLHVLLLQASLHAALQGTKVLEWPRIEVWPKSQWESEVLLGRIVEVPRRSIAPTDSTTTTTTTKRPREEDGQAEVRETKRPATNGPLVEYGSSDEDDDAEDEEVEADLIPPPQGSPGVGPEDVGVEGEDDSNDGESDEDDDSDDEASRAVGGDAGS